MKECWINVYPAGNGVAFFTKQAADAYAGHTRLYRVHVRLK